MSLCEHTNPELHAGSAEDLVKFCYLASSRGRKSANWRRSLSLLGRRSIGNCYRTNGILVATVSGSAEVRILAGDSRFKL